MGAAGSRSESARLAARTRLKCSKNGVMNAALYLAWIEDLGRADFVKVDCAACHRVALLTPARNEPVRSPIAYEMLMLKETPTT